MLNWKKEKFDYQYCIVLAMGENFVCLSNEKLVKELEGNESAFDRC